MYHSIYNLKQLQGDAFYNEFRSIPTRVTILDLSGNELYRKSGEELALIFASIPASVTTLNLSRNDLHRLNRDDLLTLLQSIPETIKCIHLNDNQLFVNQSNEEKNQLLIALRQIQESKNQHFNLSKNGDSDVGRSLLPVLTLSKNRNLPSDMTGEILSFFFPQNTSLKKIKDKITETSEKYPGPEFRFKT